MEYQEASIWIIFEDKCMAPPIDIVGQTSSLFAVVAAGSSHPAGPIDTLNEVND